MPFIGYVRFLALPLLSHPQYPGVKARFLASRASTPPTLVDLGACFGQDMRQLALDGVDLSNSLGVDKELSFLTLGHELFRDTHSDVRFEVANVLDPGDPTLLALQRRVDIVHASNFLHAFDWNRQFTVVRQIARLTRTPSEGSKPLVVGCTMGSTTPREVAIVSREQTSFCHDANSFERLWAEVGGELGFEFRVNAQKSVLERQLQVGPLAEDGMRMLVFDVERIS